MMITDEIDMSPRAVAARLDDVRALWILWSLSQRLSGCLQRPGARLECVYPKPPQTGND